MAKTSRCSEDLTRCVDKMPSAKSSSSQDSEPDNSLQEDIGLGLQQPMQRSVSYNTFVLERKNNIVSEDPAAMTIEFLRARLLSERTAAKAAKQKAQLLAKKVIELQRKLEAEVAKRNSAEDSAATALRNINEAGTFSSASFSARSMMENGESNDVSSFQQMLLTDLSSHDYSRSKSEDEIANAELYEKEKDSGEKECSQKSFIVIEDARTAVEVQPQAHHQVDNNLHCTDAYCYAPWSFVYSGSEDVILKDYSREEKDMESSASLSRQIPAVLHANLQSVIENSHQMHDALIPVSQVQVPGNQEIYIREETNSPSSEVLAAPNQIFSEQKTRNSENNEDMKSPTLLRTMSSRENRGCIDHGCSIHACSMSGAKARLQCSSYQLSKKEQQENKIGTVEGNRYYIASQEAQTPGVMATGFQRKFEVFNPKQLLHRDFQKGTNRTHNGNERNQSIKEFDGKVQSSNFQAFAKHVKPTNSRCVLHAGVAEKTANIYAVNLKAGSKKANITPKVFYGQEVPSCPFEAVSCISKKDMESQGGSQKQSMYGHGSVLSMDNLQLTNKLSSDSSVSFQDYSGCGRLQGSRSIIASVPRSDKYRQQQLHCLEMLASTEAAENQSLPLRQAQSYVDVIHGAPSSGADAMTTDFSHVDKAYSMQSSQHSSIENYSNYISLGMDGNHELISNQTINPARESIQPENQNDVRICIQENPMESVLAQNDAPSKVEIIETQQATPALEAQIIFAEHIQPGNQKNLEIKSEAKDFREQDQLARFIRSGDIQSRQNLIREQIMNPLPCSTSLETLRGNQSCVVDEYCQNVHSEITSGGSLAAARYFGTRVKGYSSLEEPETNKIPQPSLIYTGMPHLSGFTKPSHCLVFRRQSSARDWHVQEQSSMSHKGLRSQLIPLTKSP